MPTTFADEVALYQARQAANNPILALNPQSVLMGFAQSVLSSDNDTSNLIVTSAPNMFLATAQGQALLTKGADYGAFPSQGTPSTASAVFKMASGLASSTITIPANTVVATVGDGITTQSIQFMTQAVASISSGTSSSGSAQVNTLTFGTTVTFGTTQLTVTVGGQTTGTITLTTNAATSAGLIQTAVQGLSTVGAGNCIVAAVDNTHYTMTFAGALTGLIQSVSVALITAGGATSIAAPITSAVTGTTVQSTTNASAANVAAGTIVAMNTPVSGVLVSNATGDGGTAATGGTDGTLTDPNGPSKFRAQAIANIASKYGPTAIQAAILAVSGVYDSYVLDPQDGSGTISYYWCDVSRTQAGASSSAITAAVASVSPPNVTATSHAFTTINNVTAITVKYDAPAAIKNTSALNAAVKSAVVAYLQQLAHNQVPLVAPMFQFVQNYAGINGALTNFVLVSSTPDMVSSIPSPANTTIWGCPAGVSAVTIQVF